MEPQSQGADFLLPELALQGLSSFLTAQEMLQRGDREWQSLEWAVASGILNESEEGLAISDLNTVVCSSSWLWKQTWGASSLFAG